MTIYIYIVVGWFGTFFYILGTVIPTDFHFFQRGRSTTNQVEVNLTYKIELKIELKLNLTYKIEFVTLSPS